MGRNYTTMMFEMRVRWCWRCLDRASWARQVIRRSRPVDFIMVIVATAEPDPRVSYVSDLEEKMGKL